MSLSWAHEAEAMALFPASVDFGECRALARLDDCGHVLGAAVFHDWQPDRGTMEISIAASFKAWLTPSVISAVGQYIFDVAECQMLYIRVDEGNCRVRHLFRILGATEHIIPRMRGRMASEALITLTDDAWKKTRFARQKS